MAFKMFFATCLIVGLVGPAPRPSEGELLDGVKEAEEPNPGGNSVHESRGTEVDVPLDSPQSGNADTRKNTDEMLFETASSKSIDRTLENLEFALWCKKMNQDC